MNWNGSFTVRHLSILSGGGSGGGGGGGGWASYQIFKKGDLAGSQILEWVDETEGVRGGDLFRGGGGGVTVFT